MMANGTRNGTRRRRTPASSHCQRRGIGTNAFAMLLSLTIAIASIALADAAPTILRIRTTDGVVRVPLPNDDPDSTLSSILASAGVDLDEDGLKCRLGLPGRGGAPSDGVLDVSPSGADRRRTASELGLGHGSMITMVPPPPTAAEKKKENAKRAGADNGAGGANDGAAGGRFDPFPDLAKSTSYTAASRRARALSRGVSRGMTYGDISRVRGAMHVVEPQAKGPLTRVYVCQVGAARFQNHCIKGPPPKKREGQTRSSKRKEELAKVENRVALLFGTINSERVDQRRRRARTSLSSAREDEKTCDVGKVHAVWEPPGQKPAANGKHYDEARLLKNYRATAAADDAAAAATSKKRKENPVDRAIRVAGWLGMRPLGWMFSYADDDRHEDGDALPVHGRDAAVGAALQIETMKRMGREEGCKFVTLALDGRVGATEAFQLSDVCVQMVAENALVPPSTDEASKGTRFVDLKDPVVISGEETKRLDSVLLLVNTAMLSHVGLYSGGTNAPVAGNVKRASGALLVKTRKRILAALEQGEGALQELCDFDVLLALDSLIGKEESEKLCLLVRKYARGQKKGTVLDGNLKLTLQSVLEG